jgi:predicted metallo-beta-lactamase superfamily hydrolase
MHVEILGAESLGVRGLSCVVEVEDHKIVIDPGLALGYQRYGLLPHPAQVAIGEQVRRKILAALEDATDVVMSHFHGDHVPLPNANPYQLQAQQVVPLCRTARFWAKGPKGLSHNMLRRKESLREVLGRELLNAEEQQDGPLAFSPSVPHGERHGRLGTVMMTRIKSEDSVFVHASDIQLLDGEAVSLILDWQPDIVLVGGPPLYLSWLSPRRQKIAWENERPAPGPPRGYVDPRPSLAALRRRAFLAGSAVVRDGPPGDLCCGFHAASPSPARGPTRATVRGDAGARRMARGLCTRRCRYASLSGLQVGKPVKEKRTR